MHGSREGSSGLHSTCVIYVQGPLRTWTKGHGPRAQTFFNKNNIKKKSKILKIIRDKSPKFLNCPYIHIKKQKFAQGLINILSQPCLCDRRDVNYK